MAEIKISSIADGPQDGQAQTVSFYHPVTEYPYNIALFHIKGKYYALPDECKRCNGSLGKGTLHGMFILCPQDETPWNIKTGLCRYDRTQAMPSYRVKVQDEDLIITL